MNSSFTWMNIRTFCTKITYAGDSAWKVRRSRVPGGKAVPTTAVIQPVQPDKTKETHQLPESSEFPPNSSITPHFIHNRNPRNLEQLRIGDKPAGWALENPGRCFWNKLSFEMTGKHISAKVEHHTGHVPLTASSKEWCIRKFLYSTKDISAARAVGQVLARRCIEMGISELYTVYTENDRKKDKVNVFLKAFEDAGIALTEPAQYQRPVYLDDNSIDEKGWEVHDDLIAKDFPTNLKK